MTKRKGLKKNLHGKLNFEPQETTEHEEFKIK